MSDRANTFADRIEQGAESLAVHIESFSEAEWNTIVPNEKRSVGTLAHHVASMYQAEVELTLQLAVGDPIKGLTFDDIDEINANHAQEHAQVEKVETLKFLRESSRAAADRIRELTDVELDTAAAVSLNADAPLTTQFFIEDHPLRHSFQHLDSIRKLLK
jgi:hypothetical protein